MANPGTAYAFFNCRAPAIRIQSEMQTIREFAQIPPIVSLSLSAGPIKAGGDGELSAIIADARRAGIRYTLTATYPGNDNKAAATELSVFLNQAYQSPIYQKGENFFGYIFYKEGANYKKLE